MLTNTFKKLFGKKPPIPRYTRVEGWLARGGQPTADGFRMLARCGFRTIVNLRHSQDRPPKDVRDQLRVVSIPVRNHRAPTLEQALQWLNLCLDSSMHPIFVHCEEGKGRTSAFIALVRLGQGWEIDHVLSEEMRVFEFPQTEREQIAFLRTFAELLERGEIKASALNRVS